MVSCGNARAIRILSVADQRLQGCPGLPSKRRKHTDEQPGVHSINDRTKEESMHQEKDDAKHVDEARVADTSELSDAELEDAAGGVINHEEQYSLVKPQTTFDRSDILEPVNPTEMKLGDVLKKEGGGLLP